MSVKKLGGSILKIIGFGTVAGWILDAYYKKHKDEVNQLAEDVAKDVGAWIGKKIFTEQKEQTKDRQKYTYTAKNVRQDNTGKYTCFAEIDYYEVLIGDHIYIGKKNDDGMVTFFSYIGDDFERADLEAMKKNGYSLFRMIRG